MMRRDAAIVGEIYMDHVMTGFTGWPQPGEEFFTREYVQEVGGGAAITACALARLGRSVSLFGAAGREQMPWLTSRLASFGVSTDELYIGEGHTGVTISISNATDRSFFTFRGENEQLEAHLTSEDFLSRLKAHRHIHFAMPLSRSLAVYLLPALRAARCTTSLDVGHQVEWLAQSENRLTCAEVDYFLPNEREAGLLCSGGEQAFLEFTQQERWLSGVVKLGGRGAAMCVSEDWVRVPSPAATVVDTTGAGDAFNAGFIDGLLDAASNEESLRRGCVCGSKSTEVLGALGGLCSRHELEECYEQSYG
jgi:sugar/nucleoside kinase (ribokinase family)